MSVFDGLLVLGLASGLEAFSREPPCDSFGALAFRQTPETRGTAWEFLSYYPILPSRNLRDPFNNLTIDVGITNVVGKKPAPSTGFFQQPKESHRSLRANNLFLAISS